MTWLTTVRQLGDDGRVIWSQTTDRPDVAAAAHSEMARGGPDARGLLKLASKARGVAEQPEQEKS